MDGALGRVNVVFLTPDGAVRKLLPFSAYDGNFLTKMPSGDELGRAISASIMTRVRMSSGTYTNIRSFFVASRSTLTYVLLNSENSTGTLATSAPTIPSPTKPPLPSPSTLLCPCWHLLLSVVIYFPCSSVAANRSGRLTITFTHCHSYSLTLQYCPFRRLQSRWNWCRHI